MNPVEVSDMERRLPMGRTPGAGQVDLRGADLKGRRFDRADLSGAEAEGLRGEALHLVDCDLTGARLVGADLRRARFERVRLPGADLRGADLTGAVFVDCDVRWVDWRGTIGARGPRRGRQIAGSSRLSEAGAGKTST